MSLKFMAKKSWHTTNFKNVEKVWVAEHQAQEEQKKVAELQKQIMEERQIQELRKLQVASGQVVKTVDTTLDWMYEGPAAAQQQSSEEYLLGKVYQAKEEKVTDVHKVGNNAGALWLNKTTSKNDTFTRLHEDPMLMIKQQEKKNLEKILNNPLKMEKVRQTVAAAQALSSSSGLGEGIRSGKKKDEAYYLDKQEKKKSKKEAKKEMKKDAKRAAKEDKKSKSKGGRSSGDGADAPSNDRKRSRSASSSSDSEDEEKGGDFKRAAVRQNDSSSRMDKEDDADSRQRPVPEQSSRSAVVDQQKHESHRDRQEHRRDSRDRGQDRGFDRRIDDRDRDRDRDGDRSDRYHHTSSSSSSSGYNRGYDRDRDRDRQRDRSRSRDRDRGDRERERDRDRSRHQDDHRGGSVREPEESSQRPAPRVVQEENHDTAVPGTTSSSTSSSSNNLVPPVAGGEKRYGLVKGTANASTGYLGPKLDLLKKKMEEEKAEQLARQRPRESVKHLSEEEKQARIRQMEIDAGINDDRRTQRVHVNASSSSSSSSSQADDHSRKDDIVDEKESHSHGASFLKTMRSEVYTMGEGSTMTERLQQNKHYTQKGVDLDSGGFMKK